MTVRVPRATPARRPGMLLGVAFLVLPILFLTAGAPARAAETRSGRVIMGTAGAPLPPTLEVSVVELSSSGGGPVTKTVATPEGRFSYQIDPAKRYLVATVYKGVTYSSVLEPRDERDLEIEIFEITHDPGVIRVEADTTTILKGREDLFEVLQLLLVRNSSDRTFTGATGTRESEVLTVAVPEGAFDVSPGDPSNPVGISFMGRNVAVQSPIRPGETPVTYVFKVRVPRIGWQLEREVRYPTERADLLLGEGLELKAAPGFRFVEQVTLQGRRYNRYRSGNLTPGSVIAADVGYPTASSRTLLWGLATGVAAMAALFFGFSVLRRRRSTGRAADGGLGERDALIEEIALLDDNFEEGLVAESDYRSKRGEMLARLSALPKPPVERTPRKTDAKSD